MAHDRTVSPPPPPLVSVARGVAASLAILLALVLLGCDENRGTSAAPTTPATGSLVLLSGAVSATTLTTWDVRGRPATLSLPAPTIAWVSASRGGRLLATLADGVADLHTRLPAASRTRAPVRR